MLSTLGAVSWPSGVPVQNAATCVYFPNKVEVTEISKIVRSQQLQHQLVHIYMKEVILQLIQSQVYYVANSNNIFSELLYFISSIHRFKL